MISVPPFSLSPITLKVFQSVCSALSFDILSLFYLFYSLLMPPPFSRPCLLFPLCMSAHIYPSKQSEQSIWSVTLTQPLRLPDTGRCCCEAPSLSKRKGTPWPTSQQWQLRTMFEVSTSMTYNSTCPGQGGSTSLEDIAIGGKGHQGSARPFPSLPHSWKGTWSHIPSGWSCSWNSSQLSMWSSAESPQHGSVTSYWRGEWFFTGTMLGTDLLFLPISARSMQTGCRPLMFSPWL